MRSKAAVYWDTCVFIDAMNPSLKPERAPIIAPIKAMAENNELILVTSAWTLVEYHRTKGGNLRTPEEEKTISDLFKNDYIEVRSLNRAVADKARELQRAAINAGGKLNKSDAVHLATAMLSQLTEMHTFDETDLIPHDNKWGEPKIRIGKPCPPGHLTNPPPPEPRTLFTRPEQA